METQKSHSSVKIITRQKQKPEYSGLRSCLVSLVKAKVICPDFFIHCMFVCFFCTHLLLPAFNLLKTIDFFSFFFCVIAEHKLKTIINMLGTDTGGFNGGCWHECAKN